MQLPKAYAAFDLVAPLAWSFALLASPSLRLHLVTPWIILLGLVACEGEITSPGFTEPPPNDAPPGSPPIDSCRQPTAVIYEGLRPSCLGCHGESDSRPFFASLESFERLIAYSGENDASAAYVHAGQPESSQLVAILEGSSATASQMPPGIASYAELVENGNAPGAPTMAAIRRWIDELEVCDLPPPPAQAITRRMSAELIRTELQRQLGLSDEETASTGRALGSPDDSPQRVPTRERGDAHQAWESLGGSHALDGRRASNEPSQLMAQTLLPLAQAWCDLSVRSKDTLFRHATLDTNAQENPEAIRANIAFLFLHMLGEEASEADIDSLIADVFLPTERDEDVATAWTAVCATLIRDPLWITY